MKAEELMHNDLALLNVKIVRFNTYCGFVRLEDGASFPRSIKVEPIPLTPEILEKNGFIKVNSQRYDFGNPETDCYIKVNPKKEMIHVNGKNANCNMYCHQYVHELQHALRICGLDDLANNFKV